MTISRRELLHLAATMGLAVPLLGCERVISSVEESMGEGIPGRIAVAESPEIDPAFHLLSRAAFGPRPGDFEQLRLQGTDAWLNEQLQPENIDDRACDLRARRFEEMELDPGSCYEFKQSVLRVDLARHELLRAIYSKRQLLEVMVEFWSDHLNISIDKGDCIFLKPSDEKVVVRKHALGKFRDLIAASAISPAMLVYLDGKDNKKQGTHGIPNENYARELLELHTLGVHGGYTQQDVFELARCLTGWRVDDGWKRGTAYFDPALHDNGEKLLLGHRIPSGGGSRDLDVVLDIVCGHPSTAEHIATKLVARFLGTPSPSLVSRTAGDFKSTRGDIKSMLKTILSSDEFYRSRGAKLKRPFRYVVSCLRSLGADTYAHPPLVEYLTRMGQPPFQHPTPDGYSEKSSAWVGTLLWRWNFAFALASNTVPSVKIDLEHLRSSLSLTGADSIERLFSYLIGRSPKHSELEPLKKYVATFGFIDQCRRSELLGLILSSPAFQRY